MASWVVGSVVICLLVLVLVVRGGGFGERWGWEPLIRSAVDREVEEEEQVDEVKAQGATRWAVLVAGSKGYANYRHQVSLN